MVKVKYDFSTRNARDKCNNSILCKNDCKKNNCIMLGEFQGQTVQNKIVNKPNSEQV